MVLEIAEFNAQPGKADELSAGLLRGIEVIRRADGMRSIAFRRCIEDPNRFILEIEWETLEHHTVGFRGGPLFPEYRGQIAGLFVDPIVARHYEKIA